MTTTDLLEIIGHEIESRIIAHKYGDASLHANGYVTGDPCYWSLSPEAEREMNTAEIAACPTRWHAPPQDWVEFTWRGHRCFFKACSDGNGPLGHCVDSGEVVAVPIEVFPGWDARSDRDPIGAASMEDALGING